MKKNKSDIEDFILHPELNEIAKANNTQALETFKSEHPGQEEAIVQAFILLQNLKVHQKQVSQEQIDKDYNLLLGEIRRRKRVRTSLWLSISTAACICLTFIMSIFIDFPHDTDTRTSTMLSYLDSLQVNTEEVQIVSGSTKALVSDNQTITQTAEGNLVVGEEEKIKSTDIQTEFIQLVVPNGKRTSIKFHDGTMAWLNSGSKLIYPKAFADDKREIFIEGEIFIEVEKSPKRPFIVHAKAFDVTVLGTTFNINAYSEDRENSVVLVEGSVEVGFKNVKQKLTPNQGIFLNNNTAQVKTVDPYIYTCWKDGIMKIDGETLGNIFARLARHYNVKIEFNNQQLFEEKYKGRLNLKDSLDDVLKTLSISIPFTFETKENNTIHISAKTS